MSALTLPAIASANTLLYLGTDTSPSVFTTFLARLGNIDFNGVAIDMVDVSNQESVAHRVLGTLLKSGDLSFVLFWEPSSEQDQELFALLFSAPPPLRSYQLVWPDGSMWLFNAYFSKGAPKADIGKELNASCTLSIDDQIVPVYPA
jgi:hypothetical protein